MRYLTILATFLIFSCGVPSENEADRLNKAELSSEEQQQQRYTFTGEELAQEPVDDANTQEYIESEHSADKLSDQQNSSLGLTGSISQEFYPLSHVPGFPIGSGQNLNCNIKDINRAMCAITHQPYYRSRIEFTGDYINTYSSLIDTSKDILVNTEIYREDGPRNSQNWGRVFAAQHAIRDSKSTILHQYKIPLNQKSKTYLVVVRVRHPNVGWKDIQHRAYVGPKEMKQTNTGWGGNNNNTGGNSSW